MELLRREHDMHPESWTHRLMNSKKHLLSCLITAVMVLVTVFSSAISLNVAAGTSTTATKVWSGKADTSWYTGDKTSYDISTPEQLAGFSILVRDAAHADRFRGVTINLKSDIVLNDTSDFANWGTKAPSNNWDPIGKVGGPVSGYCPFAGVFNGNGHTITGMYVDTNEDAGLFCYTSGAVVKDLKITKAYVVSTATAGALVGVSENSFFSGIEVSNSTVIAKGDRFAGAGGIIGVAEKINNISVVSYAMLLSLGIVVNPVIWFDPDVTKVDDIYGTYILDSKVYDCEIRSQARIYASCAGGFIGEAHQDVAIYNGYVKDCALAAYTEFGLGGEGGIGAFVGTFEHSGIWANKIIKECSYCACVRVDKYDGALKDADLVKNVSSGWQKISGKWYYFDGNGQMVTNWKAIGGSWYYFNPSGIDKGIMATNWKQIGGKWYYFTSNGNMVTGWTRVGSTWYYFKSSGEMVTGWQYIGGNWYYFKASGAMAAGWSQVGNSWYYFKASGEMTKDWQYIGGSWYYFKSSGEMVTGWQQIGGKYYYFCSNGAMARNTYVGPYHLNSSGVWDN